MNINVYDNFFKEEDHNFILEYCETASYFYGEHDNEPVECNILESKKYCTGLVHELYHYTNSDSLSEFYYQVGGGLIKTLDQKRLFDLFSVEIEKRLPEYKPKDITRFYINCFAPSENPYFHIDGEVGTTFLYYPDKTWDLDDCGETQFFIDGSFYGIPPIPNRLISFNANIVHKATSYRNRHRFSIAIKYGIHYSEGWTD
jgi:hypothetical protein